MKTKILLLAILFFSFKGYNQTWQWTHPEPNGTATYPNDDDYAQKLATDNSGNVYELGQYKGSLYLANVYRASGAGSFIAKYDSTGKLLWYKLIYTVSAGGSITGGDLIVSNNKIFVTANYTTTSYDQYHCQAESHYTYTIGTDTFSTSAGDIGVSFASLDLNGNVLWNKKANAYRSNTTNCSNGGKVYYPPLLSTDKSNNVILTFPYNAFDGSGFTLGSDFISNGFISNGYGCENLIVIKYSSQGDFVWSNYGYQQSNSNGTVITESIAADNSGNTFITCRFDNTMKLGDLYFHPTSNDSITESVLIKISSSGIWSFVKPIANYTSYVDESRLQNLAIDNANKVYLIISAEPANNNPGVILGDTISSTRMFLIKFDNSGTVLWKKVFGNPVESINTSPYNSGFVINNNQLYVSGAIRNIGSPAFLFSNLTIPNSSCSSSENYQYFISKADTSGQFKWATLICGGANMMARSLAIFNSNVYTSGDYRVSVNSLGNLDGNFINSDFYATNMFFGRLNDQYIHVGAVTPTVLTAGCTITVPFTSYGLTFTGNTFTAELSDVNGDFTNPTAIGSTMSTGTGSITATIPATLDYGSGYIVRIKSSHILKTGYNYYAYADTNYKLTLKCPAPSSGFSSTNITATSATLNWNVVPCGKGYIIQYKPSTSTTWKDAYVSTNTGTVNLTSLTANTTYQWEVKTKCEPGSTAYYSVYTSAKTFTTTAANFAVADAEAAQSSANEIRVYPNPANNSAVVIFNTNKPGKYELALTDVSGKQLQLIHGTSLKGMNTVSLDVSSYAQSMYLVKVTDEEYGTRTLKLNKQ